MGRLADHFSKLLRSSLDTLPSSGLPGGERQGDPFELTEDAVVFERGEGSNQEHFIFCFEKVAEWNIEGEEKARDVIKYLRRAAFEFFYEQFAEDKELYTEETSYEHVKLVLRRRFGVRKDPARLVE